MKRIVLRPGSRQPTMRGEAGFTLIETLVALAIFSIIGLATFSILRHASAVRAAIRSESAQVSQTQRAFAVLTQDLANVTRSAAGEFVGAPDSLRCLCATTTSTGEKVLRQVAYALRQVDTDSGELMRRITDFQGHSDTHVLLDKITGLQFSYFKKDEGGARWVDEWQSAWGVPLAVSVQISGVTTQQTLNAIVTIRAQGGIVAK